MLENKELEERLDLAEEALLKIMHEDTSPIGGTMTLDWTRELARRYFDEVQKRDRAELSSSQVSNGA